MRFAIIENEEYARENLLKMIEELRPEWEYLFSAETVADSISELHNNPFCDIIFMDIELDDGSCFEIFDQIEIKIPVIFTTAYSDFAINAFKVNSVDYLLKPLDSKELERAIIKFEENHCLNDKINYQEIFSKKLQEKRPKRILVSNKEGYSYIPIEEIAWFEAEDKYIFIVTIEGEKRLTDLKSLNEIVQILDNEEFFQISRSVLASIKSIKSVLKYFKSRLLVDLSAGCQTKRETVSAARKLQFLSWLGHI